MLNHPAATHPSEFWLGETDMWLLAAGQHLRPWEKLGALHHRVSFAVMYVYSEHYVLPLSHDEVVHGEGSLYRKM